jgi:hypothetical protein
MGAWICLTATVRQPAQNRMVLETGMAIGHQGTEESEQPLMVEIWYAECSAEWQYDGMYLLSQTHPRAGREALHRG